MKYPEKLPQPLSADRLWWSFISPNLGMYFLGFISVAITCLSQSLIPWVMGEFVDLVWHNHGGGLPTVQKDHQVWAHWFSFSQHWTYHDYVYFLFILQIGLLVGRFGWRYFLARPTFYASAWLRELLWKVVCYFPLKDLHEKWSSGVLMSLSTSDVGSCRFIFGFTLVALFDVLFLGFFTVLAMWFISWEMTLLVLMMVPFLPVILKKLAHKETELFDQAQDYLSDFNDLCSQTVSTIRVQRLNYTGKHWEKRLLTMAEDYRQKRLQAIHMGLLFFPTMGVATLFSYTILLIVGAYKVLQGQLSIGEFLAMQSYVVLIQDPLIELGHIVSEWQRARTGLKRLGTVYQHPVDQSLVVSSKVMTRQDDLSLPAFDIRQLSFGYAERPLFHQFSLTIRQGERVGILGPVGSGKSSFLSLLSGLNQDYQGEIFLHGQSLRHYTHEELRKKIHLVPQKAFLFAQTIKENILLDLDLTDDEVWFSLKLAGLEDDVHRLPQKLNTPLGEWGINLSGGQKQRLTLARTLIRKPSILLMDDCLSAVDTVTEQRILQQLHDYLHHSTMVWVAHRRSTLKYCHRLLDFGKIFEKEKIDMILEEDKWKK